MKQLNQEKTVQFSGLETGPGTNAYCNPFCDFHCDRMHLLPENGASRKWGLKLVFWVNNGLLRFFGRMGYIPMIYVPVVSSTIRISSSVSP